MQIEPTSNDYTISYPEVESEFEVQAYLYQSLRELGIDVRGEVQVHGCFGHRPAKASCRFDLVIFKDQVATMILEVKARRVKHKTSVLDTRQGHRYPMFGIPVKFIYGIEDADSFVSSYL